MAEARLNPTIKEQMKDIPQIPFNYSEYNALKYLAALVGGVDCLQGLNRRLDIVPNGHKDLKHASTLLQHVFERVLRTVDSKHLKILSADMKTTKLYIRNSGAAHYDSIDGDLSVVDKKAYLDMVQMLTEKECMMCDKCGKDAKRCKLRKVLDRALPYTIDAGNECPYNEYSVANIENEKEILGKEYTA